MEEDYQDIISVIKKDVPVLPPEDFTEGVMARVNQMQTRTDRKAWQLLSLLKEALGGLGILPNLTITIRECAFYFFLSGVFYFVLGAVLVVGFAGIPAGAVSWLRWQPQIIILIALLLVTLGLALGRKGVSALKTVKLGTLFYIAFILLNGISLQMIFKIHKVLTMGFVSVNMVMGLLLILALQKTDGKKSA